MIACMMRSKKSKKAAKSWNLALNVCINKRSAAPAHIVTEKSNTFKNGFIFYSDYATLALLHGVSENGILAFLALFGQKNGWPVNCQTVKSQSAKSQAVKSQWTKSQSVKSQWTKSQAAKSQSAKSQSICQKPSSQKPISQKPTYKMFQLKALHMPIVFLHILMTWLCSILLCTGCLLSNAEFRYMYSRVPNSSAVTFFWGGRKNPTCTSLLGPTRLLILRIFLTCTFIQYYMFISHVYILGRKNPSCMSLLGLTRLLILRIFLPACLFSTTCL